MLFGNLIWFRIKLQSKMQIENEISVEGYKLLKPIHKGLKSIVYKAKRIVDSKAVIIKTLQSDEFSYKNSSRLRREFEIGKTIENSGVIRYLECLLINSKPVIITEDFDAISLKEFRESGELSIDRFLGIAIQLASALDVIHSKNVIHRDIKPKNIVINPQTDEIKLIDFGISTHADVGEQVDFVSESLEGTLQYISPEQTGRMNRKVDYRTDFYSLGVTFYEILTGSYPFKTEDELELIHCHIAKLPEAPHNRNKFIPVMLSNIILKLMAKPAEDRYQSAKGLKRDLEICLESWKSTKAIAEFKLGEFDERSRFQIPQKLYGRALEITQLFSLFQEVINGKRALATVVGSPGVGKSAMIHDIRKPLEESKGHFITGKFDHLQRNIPYLGFSRAFSYLIKHLLTQSDAENAILKERILSKVGKNVQSIIEIIPELEYLIGPQEPLPDVPPAESQNRFNQAFEQFVLCFASNEHPLILFLDDVQWADTASLHLLKLLLLESSVSNLLVILAYRDTEINPISGLSQLIHEIDKSSTKHLKINVKPLVLKDLSTLISDTLFVKNEQVNDLAKLIHHKTNGNPFFVNEFLKTLYQRGVIVFNSENDNWEWENAAIEKMSMTDNVVELMAQKLKELDAETLPILTLASCVGNQFNSKILAKIAKSSQKSILERLEEPIKQGLVLSLTDGFTDVSWLKEEEIPNLEFRFLHDRVHHAAYSLIEEKTRERIHFEIGTHLFLTYTNEELEDELFNVVNHFTLGIKHVNTENRFSIIQLILKAGIKAKQSNAYESAEKILNSAQSIIQKSDWNTHYDDCFKVHIEWAESTYLSGDFNQAEELFNRAFKKARTNIHKASVSFTRIVLYMNMNRYKEVADLGVEAARLLGVHLPKKPNKLHLLVPLLSIKLRLRGIDISSLKTREEMSNPELIAVMKILENATPGAYFTNQDLMALMVLKMIQLSLDHGFTASTTFAFATFGLMLGSGFGDFKSGHEFGELAVNLSNRFNNTANKAKIYQLFANFINHWTKPLKSDLPYLYQSLEFAQQSGDFVYSGFDAFIDTNTNFILGERLPELMQRCEDYIEFNSKIKMLDSYNSHKVVKRIIQRFVDKSLPLHELSDETFDEAQNLAVIKVSPNQISQQVYFMYKMILSVFFGDAKKAMEFGKQSEKLIFAPIGQMISAEHVFYYGLTAALSGKSGRGILKKSIRKFKKWSSFCAENFEHKLFFLQAELAGLDKEISEATTLYEKAIKRADDDGFIHIKALICERAARFQLEMGREELAHSYLIKAYKSYQKWGATAKLETLKQEFGFLKNVKDAKVKHSDESATTSNTSSIETTDSIDITTVIRASQSISGEIELDRLLHRMMQLMLENAGAQHGALLVVDDQNLHLQAEGNADGSIRTGSDLPLEESQHVAISIVQYVQRTKQNVVLNNAYREGIFNQDIYIQNNQIRSVLCSPVLHQGKLKAIIYLENNLTTAAFTEERLRVINLLTSQLAVSLENAVLYDDMKRLNEELKLEITERKRSEEARIQAITESLRKTEELENARKFQLSLLPKAPPKLANYEIAVFLKTATEVGGDYYDFFEDKQNRFTAIIGDATGHGLSAGMMVGMTKSALNSLQIDKLNPAEMLSRLNLAIKKANPGRLKMALNIARFNGDEVRFSSAAMPPIYHYKAAQNTVDELIVPGLPLGSPMISTFDEIEFTMNSGDLLIGVSDGLPERKNLKDEELGYQAILDIIQKNNSLSVEKMVEVLNDLGNEWSQGLANDDDITILVIKRK